MSSKQRLKAWLRVTYLDRRIGGLVAILIAVTLMAMIRVDLVSSLDWIACMKHWLLVAIAMAAHYGFSRIQYFHPLANQQYGEWLYDQPWLHPQPLPLGPWHFVWQDLLFVAMLALVGGVGGIAFPLYFNSTPVNCALLVVAVFLSGYVGAVFINAALSHEKYGALGIPVIYASLLWVWGYPLVVGALLLLATLLAHFSARRMLIHFHEVFPWRRLPMPARYSLTWEGNGWPHDFLILWIHRPVVTLENGVLIGLVTAWCAATVAHIPFFISGTRTLPIGELDSLVVGVRTLLMFFALVLVMVRAGTYFRGMRMPISLFGRFATGNLIIPRFDRVFVPFIIIFLFAWYLPQWIFWLGAPLEAVAGIPVFAISLVALAMGPTVSEWWHTGDQRIVFPKQTKNYLFTPLITLPKKNDYISTQ